MNMRNVQKAFYITTCILLLLAALAVAVVGLYHTYGLLGDREYAHAFIALVLTGWVVHNGLEQFIWVADLLEKFTQSEVPTPKDQD